MAAKEPTIVKMADYLDATENYVGWCTVCKEFTRDQTEPDAEDYDCPGCEQNTVMGAEQAMVCMEIEVEDESDD